MKLYRSVRLNATAETPLDAIEAVTWYASLDKVDQATKKIPKQFQLPSYDYEAISYEIDEYEINGSKQDILRLLNEETPKSKVRKQLDERATAHQKQLEEYLKLTPNK